MLDDLMLPHELGLDVDRGRFNYESYYAGEGDITMAEIKKMKLMRFGTVTPEDINSEEIEPDVNVEPEESTSEPISEQT